VRRRRAREQLGQDRVLVDGLEFDALGRLPLMVLRGANSDLLSEETVAEMRTHHPSIETVIVADQGHAPILSGDDLIGRIAKFVAACEIKALH